MVQKKPGRKLENTLKWMKTKTICHNMSKQCDAGKSMLRVKL